MPRKPKFRPEIRRVRLNHEQSVLACSCYNSPQCLVYVTNYRATGGYEGVHTLCRYDLHKTIESRACHREYEYSPGSYFFHTAGTDASS